MEYSRNALANGALALGVTTTHLSHISDRIISIIEAKEEAANEKLRRNEEAARMQAYKEYIVTAERVAVLTNKIAQRKALIELCETHPFFGTTFFQPQLWLRGGVQGKIQRQYIKLQTDVIYHRFCALSAAERLSICTARPRHAR